MSSRFYIQNRLYNVNNRLAALDLYEKIEEWIDQGILVDMESSYLPFKTTNNSSCDGEDGIFKMDEEHLASCTSVVGYFDGWTYDPGCAFEIGCGYAWGYPVHLITTDIYKSSVGDSAEFFYGSKLTEYVAKVVAVNDLNQNIADYRERNNDVLNRALEQFKQNLIEDFGSPRPEPVKMENLPIEYDYYIDPNFKYSEQGKMVLEKIVEAIESAQKTYVIGDNRGNIAADIDNLRKSRRGIFYFNSAEPNVDTGILQGICYGLGKKPFVYADVEQRIWMSGKWAIQLNTMNYWCAEKIAKSVKELEDAIKADGRNLGGEEI